MQSSTVLRATFADPANAIALIEEYYEAVQVVARDSREAMLQYLSDPQSAVWVAYRDSIPAGCILYRPLPQIASAGEVKRLYVRPEFRGHGLAGLLLEALEQFALTQQTAWLYLDSKDDLHAAIAFYRSHGYTPCARYNDNPQATVFMRKELFAPVTLRAFRAGDEEAFRTLNEAWIEKHFRLEEKDLQTLRDPQTHILSKGGQIFMAVRAGKSIGCCALLAMPDGSFEVSKMTVHEAGRGHGIGRKILEHVIDYARSHSIPRLYLETNNSLANAIHLYEAAGFRHLPPEQIQPSPYTRANVYMELLIP